MCSYVGEIIDAVEESKRNSRGYILQLTETAPGRNACDASLIDGRRYRNVSSFINHECKKGGNLDRRACFEYHWDKKYPHVIFFANRDIAEGEELTFNYKKGVQGKPFNPCFCDTCKLKKVSRNGDTGSVPASNIETGQ